MLTRKVASLFEATFFMHFIISIVDLPIGDVSKLKVTNKKWYK